MSEAKFREAVRYRARGMCEGPDFLPAIACLGATQAHHLKRRPHCTPAEKVDPDNGRLLCVAHHTWVTEHPEAAHELGLTIWSWEEVPHA